MPETALNARITVDSAFSSHAMDEAQLARSARVREAAADFVKVLLDQVPPCADQSAAIRHVREAAMTANFAIATRGAI